MVSGRVARAAKHQETRNFRAEYSESCKMIFSILDMSISYYKSLQKFSFLLQGTDQRMSHAFHQR